MERPRLASLVTLTATITLAVILLAMVIALLFGLFNDHVDNSKIFEMLMPAFQTIVGGFIGLITGVKLGGDGCDKEK